MKTATIQRFVVILAVLAGFCVTAAATPIEISTIAELQRIGQDPYYPLDGHYALTRDIDASSTAHWNDGAGFEPIGDRSDSENPLYFTGWFDGRGHVIRDLVINRPEMDVVGVFGSIRGNGIVENLGIEGGTVIGRNYVGALVGDNRSPGLTACFASAEVRGNSRVGGLVGINRHTIYLCYATGRVTGNAYTGGLVGRNYRALLYECYAAGVVGGTNSAGGVTGENYEGDIHACFWDIEASRCLQSAGGEGLTTDEMTRSRSFIQAGWDFRDAWTIREGRSYPYLR